SREVRDDRPVLPAAEHGDLRREECRRPRPAGAVRLHPDRDRVRRLLFAGPGRGSGPDLLEEGLQLIAAPRWALGVIVVAGIAAAIALGDHPRDCDPEGPPPGA